MPRRTKQKKWKDRSFSDVQETCPRCFDTIIARTEQGQTTRLNHGGKGLHMCMFIMAEEAKAAVKVPVQYGLPL